MWVILPVKHLQDSKVRLKEALSDEQRAHFSYLLLVDTLQTLASSNHVDGITLISSDQTLFQLAKQYDVELILTDKDDGYSKDTVKAISTMRSNEADKVAIFPADLSQLSHHDIELLDGEHQNGITLCAAEKDGGTNALIFTPPLTIPLLFGKNSFKKHQQVAKNNCIAVNVVHAEGVKRDIDRPEDLQWLSEQTSGGNAWKYIKDLSPLNIASEY